MKLPCPEHPPERAFNASELVFVTLVDVSHQLQRTTVVQWHRSIIE